MFILSSIPRGLSFWPGSHTSIYENSESNVFKNKKIWVKHLIIGQIIYYEQMYTRLLNPADNRC